MTRSRHHPGPNPALSCPILMALSSPRSGISRKKTSFFPRSKLSRLVLSGRRPLLPFAPRSSTNTFASVPAYFTSAVCTSTLYVTVRVVGLPSGPSGNRSTAVPAGEPSSSHTPACGRSNAISSPVSTVRTCTSATHHDDPNPALSCPMRARAMPAPKPAISSSNRSVFPRSKLFMALSRARVPELFPETPKSSIHTFASVPAPLQSAVVTLTTYFLSTNSEARAFSASACDACSVTCVSPPRDLSSHTCCGNRVFSHPLVTLVSVTLCSNHPGESPAPLCPIRACVKVPMSAAVSLNTSVFPLWKLSGALSRGTSRITAVAPSVRAPAALNVTAASVLAPFASPVTTVTRYSHFSSGF
mmetsp:Transcript_10166/g.42736  ORF Transcript_10166/g.42736 Transcript_10166/m.42736 type:complete len:359 (+) Transcript_10166:923-1999(+)